MNFEIHSFDSIEKKAQSEFELNTMLISIGDPDAPFPKLLYKPKHMLRLVFDDITPEAAVERVELPEILLKNQKKLQAILNMYHTYLFTDEMAKQTAEFVRANIENTDFLICQCQYGQSRSAAILYAILEYFEGRGYVVFDDIRYSPNKFVYEKLLMALKNGK